MGNANCCNTDQKEIYKHDDKIRIKSNKTKKEEARISDVSNTYQEALVLSEVIITEKQEVKIDQIIDFDHYFPKLMDAMHNYKTILKVEVEFGIGKTDFDDMMKKQL